MPASLALKNHNNIHVYPRKKRSVTILGSTGTIGCNTLDLIERNADDFEVYALTGYRNVELLARQAKKHNAKIAVIGDESKYQDLKEALTGQNIKIAAGELAVIEVASFKVDWVMAAIVGTAGLQPTLQAVRQGGCVALANKECLVSAGELFCKEVEQAETVLLPVDSEHSAAFQALVGHPEETIEQMILTASGGPFKDWSLEQLSKATLEQALKHPNWSMGRKITIDSATLMNKGLELIEAWHLFPVSADKLDVVVHPQSIVHCLVSYKDGSVLAQMSVPDMRTPIAYSLSWPERMLSPTKRLDLTELGKLTFEKPDETRFPALRLAKQVLEEGAKYGPVLNAANEVAVDAFLNQQIHFLSISLIVEKALERSVGVFDTRSDLSLEEILEIDSETRALTYSLLDYYQM